MEEDSDKDDPQLERRVAAVELKTEQDAHDTTKALLIAAGVLVACLIVGLAALVAQGARDARQFEFDDPMEEPHVASCPSGMTPQEKGEAALQTVKFPWRLLDYRVEFHPGRKGFLATTHTGEKVIRLYVRPCQSVDELGNTLAHEFGHAADDRYNTPEDRDAIQAVRGYTPRTWFGCSGCSDFATPAGDYAEAFAFIHGPPGRFRSKLAGPPDDAQVAALERFARP